MKLKLARYLTKPASYFSYYIVAGGVCAYSAVKEIESWEGFGYALREPNRSLYNKMMSEVKDRYVESPKDRPTEALFLSLILEQQKMIMELVAKISHSRQG